MVSDTCKQTIDTIFDSYNECSEYKCIQQLKKRNFYQDPITFKLCGEPNSTITDSSSQIESDNVYGVLMPIKFMLRKYFESDGMMDMVLKSLKFSTNGVFRSLIDGSIWQTRTSNMSCKTVIPINIFFDDFNTGDTASHHAKTTSICAIYLNIPCLPDYLLGRLSNILTVGFIKSQDRKKYSNEHVLYKLIEQLIDLEKEGLEISHNGTNIKVFVTLGFVLGDNLGVNGILDFVECFRANFFCRVCKRNRTQTETDSREYLHTLRTYHSYEEDVQINLISQTGLKGPSVFNRIPSFHVTFNFVFDIMHDLFEGVCLYDLQHMMHYFIYTKHYFNVKEFNDRKNGFDYGDQNADNIIHDIQEHRIKSRKLKFSANETKTLITLLPLIIGILVPEKDAVWLLLCTLIKIVHICLLREIPFELVNELRTLINVHHVEYVNLFQDNLKPKHHNLLHYPTAILKGGALRRHWSMRFEAKHK
ncbi:uncharacterized protein LOC131425878 [Malaya genurostris]|uniref:uncharacterized protein LOC131425878 n=1 Tax=Malaya genurostris TaxID=325434 RepID=UPI0026F3E579|nr:uncharacterized protein LOC131425878 [Malaya genurostris]